MWGVSSGQKIPGESSIPAWSPHVFQQAGVSVVRATALTDKEIGRQLGDFEIDEKLTLGRAIIHDKILVVNPLDPDRCVVAFGRHNIGYKASYSNDENLVIIRRNRALAEAYTAHVLYVFDLYRFRAVQAELSASAKKSSVDARAESYPQWDGFLDKTGGWQSHASRRLARYFTS